MTNAVEAKVAKIVAESQLALNRGSEAGVEIDDVVNLYRKVDVSDPDTGEYLGSVNFVKVRLTVNFVDKKLCVAQVIDREVTENVVFDLTKVKRLKQLTNSPVPPEDRLRVQVDIGERAIITKPSKLG